MIRSIARHRAALVLGALLVLGAVVAQLAGERTPNQGPPLASNDSSRTGALALALWLERLGYQVDRLEPGSQVELRDGSILFVLEPVRPFSRLEAEATLGWVRRGGALVYVPSVRSAFAQISPALSADVLNDELGIAVRIGPTAAEASAAFPFFTAPPASRFAVHTAEALDLRDDAWVPLIGTEGRTLVGTRQLGVGRVYVAVSDALFANSGIGEEDNAAFVLNILARHPEARTVVLEEAHHAPAETPGLMDEMRAQPWGWAVIYAILLTMGFLFWAGRRFGPAVARPREPARSTGEYVTSFAGLLQRTRATEWTQRQLSQALRRRLARLLGVRAETPPNDMARVFGDRYALDGSPLAASLAGLDGGPLAERQILGYVRAVEQTLRAARANATPTPQQSKQR